MSGMFKMVNPWALLVLFLIVVALFFTVFYITSWLSGRLHFIREDRITLQFAGSKKSLVHGSVFAAVLFSGMGGAGLMLMPIMIYHAFQLFYISIVARRMGRLQEHP